MLSDEEKISAFKSLGQKKFLAFCYALYPDFILGKHHRVIAKILHKVSLGKSKRVIITMPPRSGKSLLCSQLFSAWYLGKHPKHRIILASYGQDLANDFGRSIRNLMLDEKYRLIFPESKLADDSKSLKKFSLIRGGEFFAVGRGAALTGRGGNCLIIDDLTKDHQEARSSVVRNSLKQWYRETLYTRLMKKGKIIIVNTRWHQDDLVGWLLKESSDNWEHVNLPAINEKDEALWPEMFPIDVLKQTRREIGENAFSALYQQKPTPESGNIIKKEWLKFYKNLPEIDEYIQSWDLTFKDSRSSDYVVGQVWGRSGQSYYLVDQIRERLSFTETVEAIIRMSNKYPQATRKFIEDKANGPAVINHLQNKLHGIIPVNPKSSKVERLHAITPLFESKNVYLLKDEMLESELLSFPLAKHDDQVDALTQALSYFKNPAPISLVHAAPSMY